MAHVARAEPSSLPCPPADLEFATADNPDLDGEAATDAVVALVAEQLRGSFQLEAQPGWVLELDSSTQAKFSRHLVIRWAVLQQLRRVGCVEARKSPESSRGHLAVPAGARWQEVCRFPEGQQAAPSIA